MFVQEHALKLARRNVEQATYGRIADALKILIVGRESVRAGWCQGSLERVISRLVDGSPARSERCLVGALGHGWSRVVPPVGSGDWEYMGWHKAQELVKDVLLIHIPAFAKTYDEQICNVSILVSWNDAPRRTQAEVEELFTKGIDTLKLRMAELYLAEHPAREVIPEMEVAI